MKTVRVVVSLALAAAASVLPAVPAGGQAPPPNEGSPLGTNLSGLVDWSGEWPFVDAFKTSRDWIPGERNGCWDCAGPLDLDENGWVRSLDPSRPNGGQVARTLQFVDVPTYPGGRYTVVYDGQGQLTFGGGATLVSSAPGRYQVDVNPAAGFFMMTLVPLGAGLGDGHPGRERAAERATPPSCHWGRAAR
jgi:hypothetical protein